MNTRMDRRRIAGLGVSLFGAACGPRLGLAQEEGKESKETESDSTGGEGTSTNDASTAVEATEREVRAFWVDAFHDGFKTPRQVDQLIRDAQIAGVNTLIVQVRRRGDAYYNRTAEPRTDDPALTAGFDALQAVIERAHALQPRMEVHAWIATVALWNKQRQPPANPSHIFNCNGPDAPAADNWISLNDAGQAWDESNYMLDPGHPAVVRHVADVAAELAREYQVDGIHLDLVRYAGVQWGYNPTSVARYNRRHGVSGQPPAQDLRWQQWRRDQVTALVRRVYLDCLAIRPELKISAAVIGWGAGPADERAWRSTSAYRNVFQDWVGWLEEGIVDIAMPMNYDDEANLLQRAWFDRWLEWEKRRQGKRQTVAGVGLFMNEPADGLAQIRRALAPAPGGERLAGVALYSYAVSNKPERGSESPALPNSAFYAMLSGTGEASRPEGQVPPFARPALPPPMPWKEQPGALVRGTATYQGQALDGATVRLEGPKPASVTTDGSGYFGAPDLPPGTYAVTLVQANAVLARREVTLPAGRVTTVDLAG